VVSRNTRALPIEADEAILHASEERKSITARV
jgi:hypothetical protein